MNNTDLEENGLAADGETVAASESRGGMPKGLALALGVVVVVGLGWMGYREFNRSSAPANRDEQFSLAQRSPPLNFDKLTGKSDAKNKLVMLPPEPAAVTPPPDDSEARRRAAEEAERRRREERELAALRSPMLAVNGQQEERGKENDDGTGSNAMKLQSADDDPNRRFLDATAAGNVERARATSVSRIDALIPQGATIRATLETAVQSDLPGMVRAITTEDVYSFDGRRIILPQGIMLTGEYRSSIRRGQTRVFMVWTRALRRDGVSIMLGSGGTDTLGRAGVAGEVDEHYMERFGAAAMLSIVGGGSAYLSGLGQPSTASTNGGLTPQQMAQMQASQTIAQTYAEMANTTLKEQMQIPPTIHIDQGTPVIVLVRRDLDFSQFYVDPVKQALYALKHGGSPSTSPQEREPTIPPDPEVIVGPVVRSLY